MLPARSCAIASRALIIVGGTGRCRAVTETCVTTCRCASNHYLLSMSGPHTSLCPHCSEPMRAVHTTPPPDPANTPETKEDRAA